MKRFFTVPLMLVVMLGIFAAGIGDAEAKRFGSGKSFGSKNSYSNMFQRKSQPAQVAPKQGTASPVKQSGMLGGMGGLLGGLLVGGLLGSLLMGGAFEGLNFMDILIFAGIAYMLYKLFAARKPAPVTNRASYERSNMGESQASPEANSAGFNTDRLFGGDKQSPSAGSPFEPDASFNEPAPIPADFDQQSFLDGAKRAFEMMQKAWDERDLGFIRQFSTDKVFAEIQDQLREIEGDNKTDLLKLEAELLEVREVDGTQEATVLFNAMMREYDSEDSRPEQVREVWHFIRQSDSKDKAWYLDGLQQLEE